MNLKFDSNGEFHWVQDEKLFKKSFQDIAAFPKFDPNYYGPTMFIVGEKSEYVK